MKHLTEEQKLTLDMVRRGPGDRTPALELDEKSSFRSTP